MAQSISTDRCRNDQPFNPSTEKKTAMNYSVQYCRTTGCPGRCLNENGEKQFFCNKCGKVTCCVCDAVHDTESCEEYEARRRGSFNRQQTSPIKPVSTSASSNPDKSNGIDGTTRYKSLFCQTNGCHGICVLPETTKEFRCLICTRITCVPCCAVHENQSCHEYQLRKRKPVQPDQNVSGTNSDSVQEHSKPGDESSDENYVMRYCQSAGCPGQYLYEKKKKYLHCLRCNAVTCISCNAVHDPLSCEEFQFRIGRKTSIPKNGTDTKQGILSPTQVRRYCATLGCNGQGVQQSQIKQFNCPTCGKLTCVICNAVHEGLSCDAYIARKMNAMPGVYQEPRETVSKQNNLMDIRSTKNSSAAIDGKVLMTCAADECKMQFIVRRSTRTFLCPNCNQRTCYVCGSLHNEKENCKTAENTFYNGIGHYLRVPVDYLAGTVGYVQSFFTDG